MPESHHRILWPNRPLCQANCTPVVVLILGRTARDMSEVLRSSDSTIKVINSRFDPLFLFIVRVGIDRWASDESPHRTMGARSDRPYFCLLCFLLFLVLIYARFAGEFYDGGIRIFPTKKKISIFKIAEIPKTVNLHRRSVISRDYFALDRRKSGRTQRR